MEDGEWLNKDDRRKMAALKIELEKLKVEHKHFAKTKKAITPEQREKWRENSRRTKQVYIEIKDLRFKNIMEAGKG